LGFKFVVLIDHAKEKVNGAVGHSSIIYEMEVSAQLLLPENWIPILFLTKEGRPSAQLSSAQLRDLNPKTSELLTNWFDALCITCSTNRTITGQNWLWICGIWC
jgi:hypothetical protein